MHYHKTKDLLKEKYGISRSVAKELVRDVIKSLVEETFENGRVTLWGIGSFYLKTNSKRRVYNPKDKEFKQLDNFKAVKFKLASSLRIYD